MKSFIIPFLHILFSINKSAFLLKGLTVEVVDEINNRSEKYHYDNGIKSFVDYINEDKTPINNVLHFKGSKDGIEVEIAMQYTDSYNESIVSFKLFSISNIFAYLVIFFVLVS